MTHPTFPHTALPTQLSKFVYGTTRLGDEKLPEEQRIAQALRAMDTGVWFHASDQYGDALRILGMAFERAPHRVPKLIVKLGNESIAELRSAIERNTRPLGITGVDIGQLCLGGELAEDFAQGGSCLSDLRELQAEGLVGHYVLEVFPWTSHVALQALSSTHVDGLVGACIFYFNPLQRFASNQLWDLIQERQIPIVAMRTVAGGNVHQLRDVPGAAWKPYLQERAAQVAPIFEASGLQSWAEFCLRFAHSFPLVRASVGSTANLERLAELWKLSRGPIEPLPQDIVAQLSSLQRRWSDETDMTAEPWTM